MKILLLDGLFPDESASGEFPRVFRRLVPCSEATYPMHGSAETLVSAGGELIEKNLHL
jgi:hypothetical protein